MAWNIKACRASRTVSTFKVPPSESAWARIRSGCCIFSICRQSEHTPHGSPGASGLRAVERLREAQSQSAPSNAGRPREEIGMPS